MNTRNEERTTSPTSFCASPTAKRKSVVYIEYLLFINIKQKKKTATTEQMCFPLVFFKRGPAALVYTTGS